MGLLKNLKKKFNNWVDITLAELCSAYIKQVAKQTSRKQDNCSSMESLPNNLTTVHPSTIIVTSSQGTSEKTIMELKTTEDVLAHNRDWAIDRMEKVEFCGDKIALYAEFEDWIELEERDDDELEIISLDLLDD